MASIERFNGFSEECLAFFRDLSEHNTTEWFKRNRSDYDNFVLNPSRAFVVAMGERLVELTPGVVADPKVNRSLFRLNRDTRFSKDKRPYKTNLGIWFWDGPGKRMDASGFYFHLTTEGLMLAAGMHTFTKDMMSRYREAVDDDVSGGELVTIRGELESMGYPLGGEHYKRVPRGYDGGHSRGDLLRHNGLFTSVDYAVPEEFFSADLVDFCFGHYQNMVSVHRWLTRLYI